MSVLIRRSYPIKRISRSSRPRRSSARPSHHECGIVSCVSRGVRNGRAKDHPHPSPSGHRTNGLPKDRFQAAAAAAARREQKIAAAMRQRDECWRSRPQHGARGCCASCQSGGAAAACRHPLAASISCRRAPNLLRAVRSMRHGQRRRGGGRWLAAIVF